MISLGYFFVLSFGHVLVDGCDSFVACIFSVKMFD